MPAPPAPPPATTALGWLLLALFGGLGSVCRFAVALGARDRLGEWLPYGTLAVNVVGSFAIGIVATTLEGRALAGVDARTLLATGFLGGFTTYSAFNLETIKLAEAGHWARGGGYLVMTVVLCLVAGLGGISLGRAIVPWR